MELLKQIFLYDPERPLIFTQLYFWLFFGIVYSIYCFIYDKKGLRNAYLFFVSLFFYYKTSGFFFVILLFSTGADYLIGQRIYDATTRSKKQWLVAMSVFVNLFLLLYFKYAHFFVESINETFGTGFEVINHFAALTNSIFGADFRVDKILLPVGISFYTFQTISYAVDIYKDRIKPVRSLVDFGFYVSFFPQLVAGPIVRASEFIPQLYKPYRVHRYEFGWAIYMILKGLIKKMVISDYIAINLIDRVFEAPLSYTAIENVFALYGYSLQVYADFSGYTDIAIGIALLMGFRLPQNFNSPYKAINVGDFWKRWHISLSTWLKDYLYIPMGGNRSASYFTYIGLAIILFFILLLTGELWYVYLFLYFIAVFTILVLLFPKIKNNVDMNINLMLTMLIGGLWHGASWNFLIWGALNGLGLVIYKFWRKVSPWEGKSDIWIVRAWMILITFTFITFTRIFFRADSFQLANQMMEKIAGGIEWGLLGSVITSYWKPLSFFAIGLIVHWWPSSQRIQLRNWFIRSSVPVKIACCVGVAFLIFQTLSAELQPFIYFDF